MSPTTIAFLAAATGLLAAGLVACGQEEVEAGKAKREGPAPATAPAPQYPGDPVAGDPVLTASGLKYFDLVVGDGPQPAGPTSTVTVHYTGWLEDGTKFDSSVDKGRPYTTSLSRVVDGWTEGVGSMRVGGKRKLIIPAHLGYGEGGFARLIPPGATLIFDIELLAIAGQ